MGDLRQEQGRLMHDRVEGSFRRGKRTSYLNIWGILLRTRSGNLMRIPASSMLPKSTVSLQKEMRSQMSKQRSISKQKSTRRLRE